MYPKFVIVSAPGEIEGTLRIGTAWNHRDLCIAYEKVHGGGWYDKDDYKMQITLYGFSIDFGEPDLTFLDRIPTEYREYKFFFCKDSYLHPDSWKEEIDLSHVKWV